jgi:NADPH:quinone reductase-like Zn-dependent oxidoreductase
LNQENTMRALTVLEAGAQPVVADITTPEAGPGTVLVKIKAASLNAVDAAAARSPRRSAQPRARHSRVAA